MLHYIVLALASSLLVQAEEKKTSPNVTGILSEISWVEVETTEGRIDVDEFFDRVVFMALPDHQPIAPGVFITRYQILTSFNPFRKDYRQGNDPIPEIIILTGRQHTAVEENNLHDLVITKPVCVRQVVPISEKSLMKEQWHGTDGLHSPLHDLMIMRIDVELEFLPTLRTPPSPDTYPRVGPRLTNVAKPNDYLERKIKFASLGFLDKQHMMDSKVLRTRVYDEGDNMIEDCTEWFPKRWGYFICISNVDKYKGVGSGALLMQDNKLYGVGSFAMKKDGVSILVFTDLRPYYDIIFNTCQLENKTFVFPKNETSDQI